MLSSPSRQISVLLFSSTRQFHPKFTLILFPQRCLGCFYSSQAVNVKIQTGNLAFVYPFKWMWLLNVHFKVNAGILIALRDGQDLDFLSIALDSSSISMTKKKSIISHGLLHFSLQFTENFSSPLSPLSSSWLNPELLHSHRGEGLELAKDLGWVDRWREGWENRGNPLDFISYGFCGALGLVVEQLIVIFLILINVTLSYNHHNLCTVLCLFFFHWLSHGSTLNQQF